MKFKCTSQTLQKAIQMAEKAISNRTAIPVLENIHFELQGNKLKLRGNDLELGIEYQTTIEEATEDGKALIKASTISNIVSKMSNQTLNLSTEGNHVTISADNVDFELLATPVEEYPTFPEIESGTKLTLRVDELTKLIKHTIFAASTDETKKFLNGIYVKIEAETLHFVATDGFRLAFQKKQLPHSYPEIAVIVPNKTMNELLKSINGMDAAAQVEINITQNQIAFIMPDFILISRLISGQFPAYNQVIPTTTEHSFTLPNRHLITASERAAIIAAEAGNVVKLTFNKNTIRIKANAAKMGEFKEDIPVERNGGEGEMKISFNVKLILDAIKIIEGDDIILSFNNELSPCKLRPVADEEFTYIIMPIRTSDFDSQEDVQTHPPTVTAEPQAQESPAPVAESKTQDAPY